jgi:Arc/MetJ-type ribon-helix-helix transcriptional regulator
MTITLAGEQERWVADKVREGCYASPEHLTAEALKLLAARDERARELDGLRADIAVGWDQAERGELLAGPAAMAALVERSRRRLSAK